MLLSATAVATAVKFAVAVARLLVLVLSDVLACIATACYWTQSDRLQCDMLQGWCGRVGVGVEGGRCRWAVDQVA
jgi:hypothetical protein